MNGGGSLEDRFGELSCARIVELITDYLEGALPEDLRARFEEHLSYCPPCREYLAQLRATMEITGRLTESDVPPETMEALLRAFRDEAHG
ncbi:MAG TPA: anti-sigma factor [Miltoncostaea sp.]|nr:anti-sigma factor [Miltoncostaea sp.]